MLKTFVLFLTVAILSCYQSPANCRSGNIEGYLVQKMNYCYYRHFPCLEFMQLPDSLEGLPSQGRGDDRFLKIAYFLENYTGNNDWMTGDVIISEADTLTYVTIKAENHVSYRELVGTSVCKELQPRCRTNQDHHNQVRQ